MTEKWVQLIGAGQLVIKVASISGKEYLRKQGSTMNKNIRILIIENDQDNVLIFKKILSMGELDDFVADFASSGEDGLKLYKNGVHQVVIMDYRLGDLTAIEVTEKLSELPELPIIIVVTGQGDEEVAVQLLKMGVSEYLVKDSMGMYLRMIPRVIMRSLNERYLQKQKRDALEALRESQQRYQRLEENLPDIFIYSHGVDGVFTYVSPSIKTVLGYSKDEFKKHFSEYLTDHPINQEVEKFTQLSIKGIYQRPYKVEIFHKNGNIHQLLVSEIPVYDEHGKVIAVEGIAKDITEIEKFKDNPFKD